MSLSAASSFAHDPRVRRILRWLLMALCFSVLAYMVWQAGPHTLWQTLCSIPLAFAGCVAIWAVGYVLNAASFSQVIAGVTGQGPTSVTQPSFLAVLRLTISGYAINYITPFGLLGGEPYRIMVLRHYCGAQQATQSVVLYAMMHVASHFCFWLLAIVVACATLSVGDAEANSLANPLMQALLATLLLALLCLFWRLYRRGIAFRFMQRWVDWPLLNPSLLPPTAFLWALALELLSRLVNVIEYWLIMQALGFSDFGYAQALLVVAFSSLLANVLFFSPLQMGTREGGILLALQYLYPDSMLPVAITLSFATRIREFLWIGIGLLAMRLKKE